MIQKLRRDNQKGFTLIELMIVIAIIGILAAIAIPNFLSYRQKGYDAQALSDAKNFYTACVANSTGTSSQTYNSGALPPGYEGDNPDSGNFIYNATSGLVTCGAAFSHTSGTKTYTLDDKGEVTES